MRSLHCILEYGSSTIRHSHSTTIYAYDERYMHWIIGLKSVKIAWRFLYIEKKSQLPCSINFSKNIPPVTQTSAILFGILETPDIVVSSEIVHFR